ncbi:LamG domain-containing protein [Streptomyces sp. NPDC056362]|uniref:LamG domain-containing protein n=1 Tax=unclassified Streptomyces TaxID=2593676 RepID=UPI0035DE139B
MHIKETRHMPGRGRRSIMLRGAIVAAAAGSVLTGLLHLPQGGPDRVAEVAPSQAVVGTGSPVQTEAEALAVARASNKQIEVLGMRTARREIFAEPDGSFTAREYTDPIHTLRNGTWVDIDRTLVRGPDGSVTPKATAVPLVFSDGAAGKPFVTMRKAGRKIALTWPYGELSAPVLDGESATYTDVLPGVDLTVRAEAEGFAHLLVVKTPEAAADPRLAQLDFGLTAEGLKVTEGANGGLKAEDAAVGGTVFESGRPVMWDSAAVHETAAGTQGPAAVTEALAAASAEAELTPSVAPEPALEGPGGGGKTAELDLTVGDGRLSLTPDQELLQAEDTVFPVVIDPIQRPASASGWSGIMSGMPGEQDWKYSGSAGVGRCPTDYNPVSCNGVGVRRVLFAMPVSFYANKQILGATFSARVEHIYSATPTAEPIRLYRIGGKNYPLTSSTSWSSTQNDWGDHIGTVSKAISPTTCSGQPNLHFESGVGGELTSTVATAASESWSTLTLGLRAADETRLSEWKRVCGNAFLAISYNTKPKKITELSQNPGGICAAGAARPYAERPPQLQVEASDPDHADGNTDQVKVEFKVEWTDPATQTPKSYSYLAPTWQAPIPGTKFTHTVRSTIPQNTVIYWSARAWDGDAYGPWSWEGDTGRCEFIYDATLPSKPIVFSKQYPSNSVYHDGVGTYGSFTFSPDPNWGSAAHRIDIVKYKYAFDGAAMTTVNATSTGGPATVTWMPQRSGRHWVDAISVDNAGNSSTKAHYEFLVTEGTPVTAQWNLADGAGSTEASDLLGKYPAAKGTGVTFDVEGPGGKIDKAARFDGTAGSFAEVGKKVIDTSKSFSVGAWVRPTGPLSRDMVVVSQDGTGAPGFVLGYDHTARTWAFSMPVINGDPLGEWKAVASGISVVPGEWVLLTGAYDAATSEMKLYVNKDVRGTAQRRSTWETYGPLQIGRATAKTGYRAYFAGEMAEIRVFDRVVTASQVASMMTVKPVRKNYWQLDTSAAGSSPDTLAGQQSLQLAGDAKILNPPKAEDDPWYSGPWPLVGDGHLVLDGDGDYASTASAPVTGASSFTFSARVQLTTLDPDKAQTVLSLPGASTNRITVRYRPAVGTGLPTWELAVAETDGTTALVKSFTDAQRTPSTDEGGQHLAVVYDAIANQIRLYVNGELDATAYGADSTLWAATGGLQVGRSALAGGNDYLAGAIDEVRVYSGAADMTAVQQLANPTAVPEM